MRYQVRVLGSKLLSASHAGHYFSLFCPVRSSHAPLQKMPFHFMWPKDVMYLFPSMKDRNVNPDVRHDLKLLILVHRSHFFCRSWWRWYPWLCWRILAGIGQWDAFEATSTLALASGRTSWTVAVFARRCVPIHLTRASVQLIYSRSIGFKILVFYFLQLNWA